MTRKTKLTETQTLMLDELKADKIRKAQANRTLRQRLAEKVRALEEDNNSYSRVNGELIKEITILRNANTHQAKELEARDQQIRSLQKDIDGMVRTHKEQVATIHDLREKVATYKCFSDNLQSDLNASRCAAESLAKQNMNQQPEREEIKKLHARLDWTQDELRNLNRLVGLLNDKVNKSSPEDDSLFAEAMGILRSKNKPNQYDIKIITTAAKKYKQEIANSKEFSAWCVKWRDELIELMGG